MMLAPRWAIGGDMTRPPAPSTSNEQRDCLASSGPAKSEPPPLEAQRTPANRKDGMCIVVDPDNTSSRVSGEAWGLKPSVVDVRLQVVVSGPVPPIMAALAVDGCLGVEVL